RRHHLHGRARSVLGHQSAALVLLDRPAARRRCDVPAERGARRTCAADCGVAEQGVVSAPPAQAPALATHGLDKSFGSLVVAKDITIQVPQGARHALIGPNGAGKTTLINLITGMLRPDAGSIRLGDED